MSEPVEKKEEKSEKKKGGKLPIIVALVVVMAAGGFFGMKLKSGGKKTKPEVKLSKEKPVDLKEFLVNLKDHNVYCRTEISLGLAEGVDGKEFEDQAPVVRDAVNMTLQNETLAEVSTVQGLKVLKVKLAAAINKAIDEAEGKKDDSDESESKDSEASAKDGSDKDAKDAKSSAVQPAAPVNPNALVMPKHPDWDSDTGPVLKIYFDSFATQ